MKLRLIVAVGALAGGVVLAAYRRNQKTVADAALWAEATDPVPPTGGSET